MLEILLLMYLLIVFIQEMVLMDIRFIIAAILVLYVKGKIYNIVVK